MTTETVGQAFEEAKEKAAEVLEQASEKENQVLNAVDKAQNALGKVTPVPTEFDAVVPPSDLKARLDWGEPALTILDVRDRSAYNYERITGALPMSIEDLVTKAKDSFEADRDLYVYGDSDPRTAEAVTQLYNAGFTKVSALKGGLPAWKAIGGPTEGQQMG